MYKVPKDSQKQKKKKKILRWVDSIYLKVLK